MYVVASHDCNLSASQDKEPCVEVVIGKRVDKPGSDSFGKTAPDRFRKVAMTQF
jgi:hypothetical protein